MAAIHPPSGRPGSNRGDCSLAQEANLPDLPDTYTASALLLYFSMEVRSVKNDNKNIFEEYFSKL